MAGLLKFDDQIHSNQHQPTNHPKTPPLIHNISPSPPPPTIPHTPSPNVGPQKTCQRRSAISHIISTITTTTTPTKTTIQQQQTTIIIFPLFPTIINRYPHHSPRGDFHLYDLFPYPIDYLNQQRGERYITGGWLIPNQLYPPSPPQKGPNLTRHRALYL